MSAINQALIALGLAVSTSVAAQANTPPEPPTKRASAVYNLDSGLIRGDKQAYEFNECLINKGLFESRSMLDRIIVQSVGYFGWKVTESPGGKPSYHITKFNHNMFEETMKGDYTPSSATITIRSSFNYEVKNTKLDYAAVEACFNQALTAPKGFRTGWDSFAPL